MSEEKRLDMYGGILGGAVPLAVLIIGLVWLCLAERGGTQPFWACAWLALVIGLFFARKKEDYCLAAMRGIGDENGIVCVPKDDIEEAMAGADAKKIADANRVREVGEGLFVKPGIDDILRKKGILK